MPGKRQLFGLRDVDVRAISLVRKGANRRRILLFKSDDEDSGEELATGRIVKAAGDDWSVFYAIVAEPGATEDPGMYGQPGSEDVWESPEEIQKACWRFMENGGLINKQHESMDPYGQLVENAIALSDIPVGDDTIKEGSWYVAIKPTEDGREAVNKEEVGGVSIQGDGMRIAKAEAAFNELAEDDRELIAKVSSSALPDLERVPGVQNWIEKLPAAMRAAWHKSIVYRAAKHMAAERGMAVGHAIASALNWSRDICATGDVSQWPGNQTVRPTSVAECCAANALWEAMKAAAKSDN